MVLFVEPLPVEPLDEDVEDPSFESFSLPSESVAVGVFCLSASAISSAVAFCS